jgi:hypothetical protein
MFNTYWCPRYDSNVAMLTSISGCERRKSTVWCCWIDTAAHSGVRLYSFITFIRNPDPQSKDTIAGLPFWQAMNKGESENNKWLPVYK